MAKTPTTQPAGWQLLIQRFPAARLLWVTEVLQVGELRAYSLGRAVVLVHDYADGHGWTAYVDPFTTLDTAATFAAIEEYCR
jgi:hypothetical protein